MAMPRTPAKPKRKSKPKLKPKPKPKAKTKSKPKKPEREGYHLPVRSEQEQLELLSEELQIAWKRLRSFLVSLGDQRVHTSHRSIMFSRTTCYLFARPKKSYIEVNFFLAQALKSELLHKVTAVSKRKSVHVFKLTHEDQVEEPLTDWIYDAFNQAE